MIPVVRERWSCGTLRCPVMTPAWPKKSLTRKSNDCYQSYFVRTSLFIDRFSLQCHPIHHSPHHERLTEKKSLRNMRSKSQLNIESILLFWFITTNIIHLSVADVGSEHQQGFDSIETASISWLTTKDRDLLEARIVQGTNAPSGKYPFFVAGNNTECGGR